MTHGSQQLRLFRRAYRETQDLRAAAEVAGMSIGEAELTAKADAQDPPPPEAFDLIEPTKEADMANTARKEDGEGAGISGEYKKPDAAGALKIYREEIAPKEAHMATLKGDLSDPRKRIKDDCNMPRSVFDFAIKLANQEDAKRDHWLFALRGLFTELKLFMPRDLVTMADGDEGSEVIPTGERAKPKLATLGGKPADELAPGTGAAAIADMNEASAGEGDDFEASEEELAQQEGRPDRSEGDEDEQAEAAE